MLVKFAFLLLGILLCTVAGAAEDGRIQDVGDTPKDVDTNSPVERKYEKILDADDEAQAEIDVWIREHQDFAAKGAASDDAALAKRIRERFEPVKKAYEEFIKENPKHTRARIAYASFLGDIESEDAAREQLEIALKFDTNSPAIYNNLANIYGHTGELKKAFDFYTKAIELNPNEPVYYHNFGTTVYLFRVDAKEHYKITEQEVFDKAFALYSNSLRLDPTNFPLASDVAQTYYGSRPVRIPEALRAWTNALSLAHDSIEREGVHVHFARVKMLDGRFDEARSHLQGVTNSMYDELKNRLLRTISSREEEQKGTNSPAANSNLLRLNLRLDARD
jgi:tetratricopeptide (TPR) repeat protein